MDNARVKRLQRTLTLHFAILAVLSAMLVATGSESVFLPLFILFVTVFAYIFVDSLEWIELGRIGSYIGMIAATAVAVASYVYSVLNESESGQLMAVAGLLVYPEAVLFMQRKNLRIFEQLAVFLLLEMIVAALVNDNLVFGILLTPIVLLWVSSLFLFSRYASLVYLDPSIEKQTPKLAELVVRRFLTKVLGDSSKNSSVTTGLVLRSDVQSSRFVPRMMQSIPIGIGALTFAGLFFYLTPRTSPGDLRTGVRLDRGVGLPEVLTFEAVGKILPNRTPVMRVSLKRRLSDEPYDIKSPPYVRCRVFDRYVVNRQRRWLSQGEWRTSNTAYSRRFGLNERIMGLTQHGRDLVRVEFDIHKRFVSSMYVLPPVFRTESGSLDEFKYDPFKMVMQSLGESSSVSKNRSLVYVLGSAGFGAGQQLPVIPTRWDLGVDDDRFETSRLFGALISGFNRGFSETRRYTEKLISDARIQTTAANSPVRIAQAIEEHFRFSGRFSYTLDLQPPSDPNIDAIEDFIIFQRAGHCQFFASAMVVMLRQQNIPCRLVIGYRPKEFNAYGNYFLVRQSDAHAWVEVLCKHEQLVGTEYEKWLADPDKYRRYWVRFDPTPASDGEEAAIVTQQGQAIDYAEKLWKDYVVEGQKLTSDGGLYAPVKENQDAFEELRRRWQRRLSEFRSGRLIDFSSLGFQWQVTIVVIGLGLVALLLWQAFILIPKLLRWIAAPMRKAGHRLRLSYAFYERCLRLLEKVSGRKKASETPLEFTRAAQHLLSDRGESVGESLDYLTKVYYQLRFGREHVESNIDSQAIDRELKKLEKAVRSRRR